MGEFSPPFSEPPSFSLFFFSCLSNIEIIFDFSGIITKIHPPFQNPGSALANKRIEGTNERASEANRRTNDNRWTGGRRDGRMNYYQ